MSKPLPVKDFKWMTNEELGIVKHAVENWKNCETGGIPCILEVDLKYPQELHDLHNDYSLTPERSKVGGVQKLIPTLRNKEKYVLHHKNLKQYESLGLKMTKIL